jgi:hypothetical protein
VAAPIRVLVVDASRMLADIVRGLIAAEPTMHVVDASAASADVLVIGTEHDQPSGVEALLRRHPCATRLTLSDDGRAARFITHAGTQGTADDLSPSALMVFIRRAADADARDRQRNEQHPHT